MPKRLPLRSVDQSGATDTQVATWDAATLQWKPANATGLTLLTAKGDIATRTSTTVVRKGVGANGTVLIADSTQTDGLNWRALVIGDVPGVAPVASPTFTGDPKAPTPATSDNDTSIATTQFVKAVVASYALTTDLAPYALLASPTFTGDPKAPTPATSDNDTSIATTAFVQAAVSTAVTAVATYVLVPLVSALGGGSDPDLIWTDDGEILMIEVIK
jgi:hypothetical protein